METESSSSLVASESFLSVAVAVGGEGEGGGGGGGEKNQNQQQQRLPLLKIPDDPTYIYPISSFPSLSEFDLSSSFPSITVPARQVATLRKKLKSSILSRKKLNVIHNLSEDDVIPTNNNNNNDDDNDDKDRSNYRKIILKNRPNIYDEDETIKQLLSSETTTTTKTESSSSSYCCCCCCKSTHILKISYKDWTAEEVLKRILPVELETPSAFEVIGHLAHINLRNELLPFKYIIGKVLLDKNTPRIKTIVNKIGSIDTQFRTFGMEVIAGNDNAGWSLVTVKEHGCTYTLDFRKVYWNSRLSSEHRRLVEIISKEGKGVVVDNNISNKEDNKKSSSSNIVVADLMAGIGPFAVPLSKKGITVYANDLNPSSYEYLVVNAKKNKYNRNNNKDDLKLKCYNMDAREFCHYLQDEGIDFHHVLMNLPASAPEFLDAFRGFKGKILPRIHVHCFGPKVATTTTTTTTTTGEGESQQSQQRQQPNQAIIERCSNALGWPLEVDKVKIHMVRDVAPKKNMYCVSFDLPQEVRNLSRIQIQKNEQEDDEVEEEPEPVPKRTKI